MNNLEKTIMELYGMLKTVEINIEPHIENSSSITSIKEMTYLDVRSWSLQGVREWLSWTSKI